MCSTYLKLPQHELAKSCHEASDANRSGDDALMPRRVERVLLSTASLHGIRRTVLKHAQNPEAVNNKHNNTHTQHARVRTLNLAYYKRIPTQSPGAVSTRAQTRKSRFFKAPPPLCCVGFKPSAIPRIGPGDVKVCVLFPFGVLKRLL